MEGGCQQKNDRRVGGRSQDQATVGEEKRNPKETSEGEPGGTNSLKASLKKLLYCWVILMTKKIREHLKTRKSTEEGEKNYLCLFWSRGEGSRSPNYSI